MTSRKFWCLILWYTLTILITLETFLITFDHFWKHSFYKSISEQKSGESKTFKQSHTQFLNIILRRGNPYKLLTCYPWFYEVIIILLAFFLQLLFLSHFSNCYSVLDFNTTHSHRIHGTPELALHNVLCEVSVGTNAEEHLHFLPPSLCQVLLNSFPG